ncbi:CAP domain-containing protein [Aurantiacibacter sp. D1-12]|uniref:CAP domain-containing protein n=1 Tax=Aurantiacibacter sp. D1-12 TaxID=2993658 RepID=UPI00237CE413|nr:CAP domain-containing protein [Aurantiacibacter sp. D1-12]MDE1467294.1 CAP domain-containing protein [Aurantiacibacter sp. D1-12]
MRRPTAEEQLMLELINRLRMDPQGEYARLTTPEVLAEIQGALNYFGVDLSSFEAAMNSFAAVAPLAWNDNLATAASGHNVAMISADSQSHQLPGEPGIGQRATDAGYTGWNRLGENIYAFSNSIIYGHAGFVIDWGFDDVDFDSNGQRYSDWQSRGDGIQDPAGHLLSLMNGNFTEVGIAIDLETDPSTDVGPYVITQDFGHRFAYNAQFLGVVIDDTDGDDFYDIGEGMGGVTVTLVGTSGTYATTTWDSGGWQIEVPAGTYDITFSGGALDGTIVANATLGSTNVKLDVEADDAVVPGIRIDGTGNHETIDGSQRDEWIYGYGGRDNLLGRGGNDRLDGGPGNDSLQGGPGNDILIGGDGSDTLNGNNGDDDMRGGAGNDRYVVNSLGDTVTELAGEGTDTVYAHVNWVLGDNVENLRVRAGATTGTGNGLANTLIAHSSGSTLYGMAGADKLIGSQAIDTLFGGAGDDSFFGKGSADTMYGDAGNDILRGDAGNDVLNGGAGADNLRGGTDDDILSGGAGTDVLYGNSGNDTLTGGADRDVMFGGSGADTFVFADGDMAGTKFGDSERIRDFDTTEGDMLDLSGLDAIMGGSDDAFDFIGNAAFSGTAGELRFAFTNGSTMIYMDVDGDAVADYAIRLDGTINLAEANFVL